MKTLIGTFTNTDIQSLFDVLLSDAIQHHHQRWQRWRQQRQHGVSPRCLASIKGRDARSEMSLSNYGDLCSNFFFRARAVLLFTWQQFKQEAFMSRQKKFNAICLSLDRLSVSVTRLRRRTVLPFPIFDSGFELCAMPTTFISLLAIYLRRFSHLNYAEL